MEKIPGRSQHASLRLTILRIILLIATSIIAYLALVLPLALRPSTLPLQIGDVAPRDLQAPRTIEYVSEVRTEEARQAAERAVPQIFAPSDPAIARHQIERLRETLQFIAIVQSDTLSTTEQKQTDLTSLVDVRLKPETISYILSLSPLSWDIIQQEALSVLEQVMRNTIRQNELETIRRNVPSLVSLTLSEEQALLVSELVTAFILPNSLVSPELTDSARQVARDSVEPVVQSFKNGETIVQSGEVISPVDMEALQILGLIQPKQLWQNYLGAGALTVLAAMFIGLYLARRRPPILTDFRSLTLIAFILLIFLYGARLTIPDRTVIPYLYPLPAFGLLLATFFGIEAALVFSLVACILTAYGLPNTLDLMLYYLMTSFCGVLVLGTARRVWAYFRSGIAIAGAGAVVILAYRLPFTLTDWVGITTLVGTAVFNGLLSASLTLVLQFFLAQLLGKTTALQLLEVSRPDSTLLKFFLHNAPGTYQHSLQVANLAEQAAERIGADALLTRVGALFHDIGKALNPFFFIENQAPGSMDAHQDLDPVVTAQTIIRHVSDGLILARKHHLPRRIQDFIIEHHGTLITRYQYNQAIESIGDASKVDMNAFRYPGPRPHSRETALLMLADGVEARARAEKPKNDEELRILIESVVESRQKENQLNSTQLTLHDLQQVIEIFYTIMRSAFHPRIQYPKMELPQSSYKDVATKPNKHIRHK